MKVEDLELGDEIEIDHGLFPEAAAVVGRDEADIGLMKIPIAVIVFEDDKEEYGLIGNCTEHGLIGNCTDPQGKTIQVRDGDDEDVAKIAPRQIKTINT